jgi:phage terminase small subunit
MSERLYELDPPADTSEAVAAAWRRSVPAILRAYRVTAADIDALARYCQANAMMREAELLVERDGLVTEAGRSTGAARALRDAIALQERVLRRLKPEAGLGAPPAGALIESLYREGIIDEAPDVSDEARQWVAAYFAEKGIEPSAVPGDERIVVPA